MGHILVTLIHGVFLLSNSLMAYHELCKNILGTETQDPLVPIDGTAEYLDLQLLTP